MPRPHECRFTVTRPQTGVRPPQLIGQASEHLDTEPRPLLQFVEEVVAAHRHDHHCGLGHRTRRPRPVVDGGQLAEDVAALFAPQRQLSTGGQCHEHSNPSALADEYAKRPITLAEQAVSWRVGASVSAFRYQPGNGDAGNRLHDPSRRAQRISAAHSVINVIDAIGYIGNTGVEGGNYIQFPQQNLGGSGFVIVGEGFYENFGGFNRIRLEIQSTENGIAKLCTLYYQ